MEVFEFIYRNPISDSQIKGHLAGSLADVENLPNPDDEASSKRKLKITQMLNQARGLGWEIPKDWSGWTYSNLPASIQELNDEELNEILENQAKLLIPVSPTTECKDAHNWRNKVQTYMQISLSKAGDLYWSPPINYIYKGSSKHFYVYNTEGTKKDVKWRREPKLNNKELPDCYPSYSKYNEAKLRKHFGQWPVAFLPSRWASDLDKEPLLQLFGNGVVTMTEDGTTVPLNSKSKHKSKQEVVEEVSEDVISDWAESLLSDEPELDANSELPGIYLLKQKKPVSMIIGQTEEVVREKAASLEKTLGADQSKFVIQSMKTWVPKEPHLSKALESIKSEKVWIFVKGGTKRKRRSK